MTAPMFNRRQILKTLTAATAGVVGASLIGSSAVPPTPLMSATAGATSG